MPSVIMLIGIMLNVIMLYVIMLNVVAPREDVIQKWCSGEAANGGKDFEKTEKDSFSPPNFYGGC